MKTVKNMIRKKTRLIYQPILMIFLMVGFLVGLPAGDALAAENQYTTADCIRCHNLDSEESHLRIDTDGWGTSVHAVGFKCSECHIGVTSDYHASKIGSGKVDCVQCHQKRKAHGGEEAGANRPDCVQCHNRHRIYERSNPASSLHINNLKETCGKCHPGETGQIKFPANLVSIRIESHNKQDLSQDFSMDNCFGCHQGKAAHGELEVIEPASCPDCHMTENGENALLGYAHPKTDAEKQPAVFATALAYQMLIVALVILGAVFIIQRTRRRSGKRSTLNS